MWSPDGSKIAFVSSTWSDRGCASRRRACHSADAPSPSLLKHLLNRRAGCSRMTVSPTAPGCVAGTLMVVGTDGTGLVELTPGLKASLGWSVWEPDGESLCCIGHEHPRDRPVTGILSPSMLKHVLKGEGGGSRMTGSPTALGMNAAGLGSTVCRPTGRGSRPRSGGRRRRWPRATGRGSRWLAGTAVGETCLLCRTHPLCVWWAFRCGWRRGGQQTDSLAGG